MEKIEKSTDCLNYVADYLIAALNELTHKRSGTDFTEGEITAYVECLEALSMWKGFTRFRTEEIERIYPVR